MAENTEAKETKAVKKTKSSSAQKQARVAGRRQLRNKSVRSLVKTNVAKAEKLVVTGEQEAARKAVVAAAASLDKAAVKGIIHRNNAARRKSRLVKKLNAAAASPAAGSKAEKTE